MDKQFMSWHKQLIRGLLFSLYAAVTLDASSSIAAPRGKLEDWRFSPQNSQLEISLSAPSRPQYFYLAQPPRIVVDLPSTKLGYVPTQQTYNGAVQKIRVSQLNDDVTRIVMDLAPGAFFDRDRLQLQPISQNPTRWVLTPVIADNNNFPTQYPPGVGGDLPPGAYSPSQPPTNPFYAPQPPINPSYNPQTPDNLPPGMYNPSQLPFNPNTPPVSPIPSTLPPINNGNNGYFQQPTVSVPPITNNRLSPFPNTVLPPATFPSPSGNFNAPPSLFPAPPYNFPNNNLPAVNTPGNSVNSPNSGIIEFGQPFPNPNQ